MGAVGEEDRTNHLNGHQRKQQASHAQSGTRHDAPRVLQLATLLPAIVAALGSCLNQAEPVAGGGAATELENDPDNVVEISFHGDW